MMRNVSRKIKTVFLILVCMFFAVGMPRQVQAYTQEEKQMVKDWLSAHGYSPTWDGAYAAYDDYLAGRLVIDDPRAKEYLGTPYPTATPKIDEIPADEKKPDDTTKGNTGNSPEGSNPEGDTQGQPQEVSGSQPEEIPEVGEMSEIYEMFHEDEEENPFEGEEAKAGSSEESSERMKKAAEANAAGEEDGSAKKDSETAGDTSLESAENHFPGMVLWIVPVILIGAVIVFVICKTKKQ